MLPNLNREQLRQLWENALAEDGFDKDITSLVMVNETLAGTSRIVSRQAGVFAGAVIFDVLREAHVQRLTVETLVEDGAKLKANTTIATLTGPIKLLLGIERTLLNFLQRLCGVATLTRRYVDAVAGTKTKVYDTRKTIPGWRQLDKYAVRCGGGHNHRMGLHDAILVKDNHLSHIKLDQLAAATSEMVSDASRLNPPPEFVEFEVDNLEQLDELFKVSGIDVILLDNFTIDQMRKAVARRDKQGLAGKIELEASGGVDLENVKAVTKTGVDRIAIGAITHSAPGLDIGMEIETGI
ncbi:MAG: carboxylating nicotinate-nucleotide diphosphorylase [Planctomycetota bacterium]|jgi:nicotinate-nucleotide pyrophosphorylase (carboxylating)